MSEDTEIQKIQQSEEGPNVGEDDDFACCYDDDPCGCCDAPCCC